VVLSGAVQICHDSEEGMKKVVRHGPGHFVGDLSTLTGRAAVIQARPLGSGPAGGVGEDPLTPGLGHGVILEIELLVGGGDARSR
jgi:hypothetical protein